MQWKSSNARSHASRAASTSRAASCGWYQSNDPSGTTTWVFENSGFGGDPTKNTYPFTGEYDWFRFYKWDQDDKYPCAPLPADDKDLSANNPKETP